MGVMVPCHDILAKAKEVNADIVGASTMTATPPGP
ncbi:MAG: hypothetical protein ACK4ZN_13940 [Oceanibaculum sp.]